MSQWSKSAYDGPITNGWEQDGGKFTFPNGVVYDGNYDKGEFHGEGTLIYPNGVSYTIFSTSKQLNNFESFDVGFLPDFIT